MGSSCVYKIAKYKWSWILSCLHKIAKTTKHIGIQGRSTVGSILVLISLYERASSSHQLLHLRKKYLWYFLLLFDKCLSRKVTSCMSVLKYVFHNEFVSVLFQVSAYSGTSIDSLRLKLLGKATVNFKAHSDWTQQSEFSAMDCVNAEIENFLSVWGNAIVHCGKYRPPRLVWMSP